ncbi:MAG: hypothetical protein P8M80_15680 [Pirellulaceae bacterium]|nr:hypothetical protein [Pirellulaceae bacterium]
MKAASIAELRKSLIRFDQGDLLEACLRLARFKKDNKELLTYLLFLSQDEPRFISGLCEEIDEQFLLTPNAQKKTLRRIIRWMEKWLRFSGVNETEIEVRLHFCHALRSSDTPFRSNRVMTNMYEGQLKKIGKAVSKLHEDARSEYQAELGALGGSMV